MLTVHHLSISVSDRVIWLCEELGLPYELVRYQRHPVSKVAPPEYKALHPIRTAPIIVDGPVVLGESGAVLEYLLGRYGGGRLAVPPASPDYPDYVFWFHFANASLMATIFNRILIKMIDRTAFAKDGFENGTIETINGRLPESLAMINERLGKAKYFAGAEFTAADIIMFFPLTSFRALQPYDISPYPNIVPYLQRVASRPGYQRAMKIADPDFAPALT